MACIRKPLVFSSIFVAIFATGVFFGLQFLDLSPKQKPHVYAPLDSELTAENQSHRQTLSTGVKNQEAPLASGDDLVIKDEQEIDTAYSLRIPTTAAKDMKVNFWTWRDTSIRNVVVWGTVETDFGEVVTGETVVFYSALRRQRYSTLSNDYGEFVFTDIKPATDYVVTVSPRGMYKRYVESNINLNLNQEIHIIILETLPVGVLRGTVVDSYDRPLTGIELSIRTVEKDYLSINAVTDAFGVFTVTGFPKGRFEVSFGSQQSFTATGLNFDPDNGEPIRLTVDLGPYTLGGHIYNESGQPFDRANVVVIWTVQENGITSRSTRQVSADVTGAFRFTGLGPGDHALLVSASDGGAYIQAIKQIVNLGVDPGEINIILNTL